MPVAADLTDAELRDVAEQVLRESMRDLPFQGAEVVTARDWSDEPSIYVIADVGSGVPPLDGPTFSRVHARLHEAFLTRGEQRFPYFRIRRADDEPPDEEAVTPGPT